MRVCFKCYSDLNAVRTQVCSKAMVKVLQFKATVWPKVASESTYEAHKFQNFLEEHPPDSPRCFCFRTASGLKLGGLGTRPRKRVPTLCPGIGRVLATPLACPQWSMVPSPRWSCPQVEDGALLPWLHSRDSLVLFLRNMTNRTAAP